MRCNVSCNCNFTSYKALKAIKTNYKFDMKSVQDKNSHCRTQLQEKKIQLKSIDIWQSHLRGRSNITRYKVAISKSILRGIVAINEKKL